MELKDEQNIFSEWLEKLQQESWQLELLISGFALFGIWESRTMLQSFQDYVTVNSPADNPGGLIALKMFGVLLATAWMIFFLNLLIHVILRGLWIGAIGLRYVSGEIDYKQLDFSEVFDDYFKRKVGRFDKYIERLEKVCSVIFAYTFLLFFIFLSATLFFIATTLIANLLNYVAGETGSTAPGFFVLLFVILGAFVFIDFITLGSLKRVRNKGFAKVYKYIYRFYSFITLSFVYRPLLYNFIDNKHTRRLFWFSIPYVFILFAVLPNFFLEANPYFPSFKKTQEYYNEVGKHMVLWNNYDNIREEILLINKNQKRRVIKRISLGSSEMSGPVGKLFLRQSSADDELLSKNFDIQPYRNTGLGHRITFKSKKDSTIIELEKQKEAALVEIINARRAEKKESLATKEKSDKTPFEFGQDIGRHGTKGLNWEEHWQTRIDSTSTYWDQKISLAREEKLITIKEALLQINEVAIDGQPYNDLLSCKFYVHPNLKEKGLLCYFPIDSLAVGEHILTHNRTFNINNENNSVTTVLNLPFWKINN